MLAARGWNVIIRMLSEKGSQRNFTILIALSKGPSQQTEPTSHEDDQKYHDTVEETTRQLPKDSAKPV